MLANQSYPQIPLPTIVFVWNFMFKFKKEVFHLIISIVLILSIGVFLGYTIGYYWSAEKTLPEIKIVDEINPGIPTIKMMEVKNGILYGELGGKNARIAYAPDKILEIKNNEAFEIPLNQIRLKDFYVTKSLPEDTSFIASKQGKYYYSVFDKRAFNISTGNRIYFKTKEEAEKSGYQAPK